ncbi:MAG: hypothetical protein ACOY8P_09730 [Thermodesulfobacteriota bacterium]
MAQKSDKTKAKKLTPELAARKSEEAMIGGIIEGSPDAVGVAVIRLDCGCRKMAAVDKEGEPASKVIIYRDEALSICDQCKADNGAYARVTEQFIHWEKGDLPEATKARIIAKVLGTTTCH